MRELNEIKHDLDSCSRELIKLLEKRLDCAAELMEYKRPMDFLFFRRKKISAMKACMMI